MTSPTQISPGGLPLPGLNDDANVPEDMGALAAAIDPRTEARFTTVANRDATYPAAVAGLGARCLITGTKARYMVWAAAAGGALAWYQCTADGAIFAASQAARDALATVDGLAVLRTDLKRIERYYGGVWGSNVRGASAASLAGTGTQAIVNSLFTMVTLNGASEVRGSGLTVDTTNGRITAQIACLVLASGSCEFEGNSAGRRVACIYKNGVLWDKSREYDSMASTASVFLGTPTVLIPMAANDYLNLALYQDSGGPINTVRDYDQLNVVVVSQD